MGLLMMIASYCGSRTTHSLLNECSRKSRRMAKTWSVLPDHLQKLQHVDILQLFQHIATYNAAHAYTLLFQLSPLSWYIELLQEPRHQTVLLWLWSGIDRKYGINRDEHKSNSPEARICVVTWESDFWSNSPPKMNLQYLATCRKPKKWEIKSWNTPL